MKTSRVYELSGQPSYGNVTCIRKRSEDLAEQFETFETKHI